MSLIITIRVHEGIVMAGDSRATFNVQKVENHETVRGVGVHCTDTSHKVFLAPNNVGIAWCGDAACEGKPLSGFLEKFILSEITKETPAEEVAPLLLSYFKKFNSVPKSAFHVAGFTGAGGVATARVWRVFPSENRMESINEDKPGACWNGEVDVLIRLLQPVAIPNPEGKVQPMATFPVPWDLFTLQDAVDFAAYAIATTIDAMRFQLRPKTVGGPVDILALKAGESVWVKHKTLEVP